MKTRSLMGAAAVLAFSTSVSAAKPPTNEQLWKLVQEQQAQIDALRAELQATRQAVAVTGQQARATETKILASEQRLVAAETSLQERPEPAPAMTQWAANSQFGGYGEMHYNAGDKDEIDLHRFVLYFGHQFNDRIRFNSELEVEHVLAGDGEPGEVEIEQAYVEFDLNPSLRARGGLFLVPVGILNEVHEPTTFYGVERNPVESQIIPSTWWEGGASLSGRSQSGWSWDTAVHSGLAASPGSSYAVRSARQEVAEATAKDAAFTGRLKYTGIPGLQLAASVQYQNDITQGNDPLAGAATLFETHAIWNWQAFGVKALYARWDLDGNGPRSVGADVQKGFYIEPSYRLNPKFGVFARYSEWDNQAGDSIDSQRRQTDVGINYWPHPDVVLKADYQMQEAPQGSSKDDRINLGIGYQF